MVFLMARQKTEAALTQAIINYNFKLRNVCNTSANVDACDEYVCNICVDDMYVSSIWVDVYMWYVRVLYISYVYVFQVSWSSNFIDIIKLLAFISGEGARQRQV